MDMKLSTVGVGLIGVVIGILALKIYEHSSAPAGTDSPVTVRGGAMTVRTKDQGGWVNIGNNSWCTDIGDLGAFSISLDALTGTKPSTFPVGSTLTINGRAGNNDDPDNGIQLTSQTGGCGNESGPSIKLSPITSATSTSFFYPDASSVNEDGGKIKAKRFWNQNSKNCVGPNPAATATGDEDTCERASTIALTVSGATSTYRCKNGECVIGIGK
jgi:hypothetical protein